MKTPDGFDRWNPALRGAYRKGWDAGLSGEPRGSCPYADLRNHRGTLTWSRAFQRAWDDGWSAGDEQRKQDHITDFYTSGKQHGRRPSTWVR